MAVYFLYMKTFGRANGSSAVNAAAYRAGERLRDERTGRTYDHSFRDGVLHKEIVLPSKFADSDLGWATERASLWNAAEAAESRKNARVAREFLVALPTELDDGRRRALAVAFARDLSDRYRFAVDLAVHAPRTDPRNHHAHLLATTREVKIEGLGAKTTLEVDDARRSALGLEPFYREMLGLRERWAIATNTALAAANVPVRVDHRSLEAQGVDREPRPQLPREVWLIEQRGERSVLGERIRAEYAARVAARLARIVTTTATATTAVAVGREPEPSGERGRAAGPESLETVRRRAREAWLELRRRESATPDPIATSRGIDDDLSR